MNVLGRITGAIVEWCVAGLLHRIIIIKVGGKVDLFMSLWLV